MLTDDVTALLEVNINLTHALESLEDVPAEDFADPEYRLRLVELIARAGGIVASEQAGGFTAKQGDEE
jgi:hypothetical protein